MLGINLFFMLLNLCRIIRFNRIISWANSLLFRDINKNLSFYISGWDVFVRGNSLFFVGWKYHISI